MSHINRLALAQTVREAQDRVRVGRAKRPSEGDMRAWVEWTGKIARARRRRTALMLAGSIVALALVASAIVMHARQSKATFAVGPAEAAVVGVEGQWIRAQSGAAIPVRFSAGGTIAFLPDARGRVVQATPAGGAVTLETGTLRANVLDAPSAEWQISAGPFLVTAHAAEVELSWDPDSEVLTVGVEEGSAGVSGPILTSPLTLERQQRLFVSLSDRQTLLGHLR